MTRGINKSFFMFLHKDNQTVVNIEDISRVTWSDRGSGGVLMMRNGDTLTLNKAECDEIFAQLGFEEA